MSESVLVEPIKPCRQFGAYAALRGIDGVLPLLHSPCGCHYYLRNCLYFHDGEDAIAPCTGVYGSDIVNGGTGKLKQALLKADRVYNPEIIAILPGCGPAMILDDCIGAAQEVQNQVKAKIISIDSGGFLGDHVSGYVTTLFRLAEALMNADMKKAERSVNIIGMIPYYDWNWRSDGVELKRMIESLGLKLNCFLTGHTSLSEVERFPQAELNIVLSNVRGLDFAKYAEKEYGQSYVCADLPAPIGVGCTSDWLHEIASFFNLTKTAERVVQKETRMATSVLKRAKLGIFTIFIPQTTVGIICDPARASGLLRFVYDEIGLYPTFVGLTEHSQEAEILIKSTVSELKTDTRIINQGDAYEFTKAIETLKPTIVFGSSFERGIVREIGGQLIRMTYPVFDTVTLYDRPYFGFNGTPRLLEEVINAVLRGIFELPMIKER